MQDMARNIKRTCNGSIDYAYYDRLARRLRGQAAHRSVASQRKAMLVAPGVATKATWHSVGRLAAPAWRACRAIVRFWNIPPLGRPINYGSIRAVAQTGLVSDDNQRARA